MKTHVKKEKGKRRREREQIAFREVIGSFARDWWSRGSKNGQKEA